MSLFITNDKHPKVYKNDGKVIARNQDVFKQDTTSEMIEAQKQANDSLRRSFQALEESYVRQARMESRRMTSVRYNLKQLNDRYSEQQEVETEVAKVLGKYSDKNEELSSKIEQQIELQQELASQMAKQEVFQYDVMNRLDKQEALTERMMRKMDHFRTLLYERTNLLTEKIEQGYTSTSAYIHKIMRVRKEPTIPQEKQESLD